MRKHLLYTGIGLLMAFSVSADDLQIVNLNSPSTACGHTASENVNILISNTGAAVPGGYTIGYSYYRDGVFVATITQTGDPIGMNGFASKSFSTPANMSITGVYTFELFVTYVGDPNNANDTLVRVVNSDPNTVPGVIQFGDTVCTGANNDTLQLVGNVGGVVDWIKSTNGGSSWVPVAGSTTVDSSFEYTNLSTTTLFAAVIRSGSCPFDTATPARIQVDPATVPGTISGAGNVCVGSNPILTLTGHSGTIIDWVSSQNPAGPWNGLSNTTTTLNLTNIQATDDTLFKVYVQLGVCLLDSTPVAALTIDQPSIGGTISQTGGNDTVCSGSNSGTLLLSGERGTVVNWQVSTGGPFSNIGGTAGNTTFNFNNITQTSTYRVVVKNGDCASIVSASFTITVDPNTVGGTINSSATVCTGGSGGLSLIGNVGTVLLWEQSINGGGSWTPIPATAGQLNIPYGPLTQTTLFRAQVKSGYCAQIPSASATITVSSPTVGGTISVPAAADTVCANNNSDTITLGGANGTIVQWESSTDGVNFSQVIPLNTSNSLNFNNLSATTFYRVRVQNSPCPADFSDTAVIEILPASIAGTISGPGTVCLGNTANLNLNGESGTIKRWEVSTNGGASFSTIGGSAGQGSISPTVSTNSLFRVIVQNGNCDSAITPNFAVNVDPVTVPGAITSNATECGGSNSATLNLNGHTGSVIRWILSTNGGASWSNIGGTAGDTTFTYNNLTQTTMYSARIKSGVCLEDSASPATITVIPAAVGGTASIAPLDDTVCAGNRTTTMTTNGTQTGSVLSWEFSTNGGGSYTVQPASAGSTYAAPLFPYTTNTLWRANVQNGAGCPIVKSTPALVVVNAPSVGGTTAGTDSVCGGSNNGFVSISGHTGSVVRWESSTNSGASWTPIPNSDSTAHNYVGLNSHTWFRAIVKNGECSQAISDTAIISIIPAAVGGTVNYAGPDVCAGANSVNLTLSGSSGLIQNWQTSTDSAAWVDVAPVNTTTSHTDNNLNQTTWYRVRLQAGACPPVFSVPAKVVVDPVSDAGTINGSAQHCDTGNTGQILITGYTGTITGWRSRVNGGAFTGLFSAGQDTITYNNLSAGLHEYEVIVQSGVCDADTSLFATIDVDPTVVPGTLSGGASYCTLTNSTLLELNGYTDSVIVWQQSTNGGASFTNIANTGGRDTVTFVNITTPTIYRVIVTSGNGNCGTDTSNTQTIGVGQSIGGTLNSNAQVCISGHTGLMQLTGYTGSIINWQDSTQGNPWANIGNAGIDTLRYTNLTQTTHYRVIVQSGSCDPDTSTFVTITVNDTVFAGTLNQNLTFCDTTNSDTLLLTGYFGPILNWQVAVDGGPFTDFSPIKTDSAFIFNNLQDSIREYRVIMNGGVCGSDTSNIASIQVGASLGGILLSGDTLCSGNNDGVIRLVGYRGMILGWDSSTVSGIFAPMGHTLDSLVYADIDDTTSYRVRVQNPGCPVDTSDTVTIVTIPGTQSGTLIGSKSICDTVNMDSVILVGRQGSILLWQFSINGGATWDTLAGQLTDTFVFNNLDTSTMYRVIIDSAGSCPNDTSNIVNIQIGPSNAGVISGDTQICAGDVANLALTGFTGDIQTWETSLDSSSWTPMPNSDTNIISPTLFNTTHFRVIVRSDTCTPDTSLGYTVVVDQPYTAGFITPTTQLCYGIGSDTIFLAALVDTIFDWEFRPDSVSTFTSLNNDTTFQTYDTLKITHHYRVFVKNGICPVDTAQITLTVDTFTLAGSITGDDTICAGNNGDTISLSGHIGNTFTWQASTDTVNWLPAPGATNDTFYVYNNLTDTTYYRLIVASGGCPPDTTNRVLIVVKPSAIGGTVLSDTSYCEGPNGGTLLLTGQEGNIVGWQQSIGGGPFANVNPPNTTDSLVYNNLDTTTSYRVIMSLGDCPDDTSTFATVAILNRPVADITPDGATEFCEGGNVNLDASGGPDYLWSTNDTVSSINVSSSGTYIVTITDTLTGCTDADTQIVTVFPIPTVDAGANVTILEGQSTVLNASGGVTYEWTPKTNLSDGFIASPSADPTSTITYFITGTDSNGCSAIDSVIVTVEMGEDTVEATQFTNLFTPNGDGHNDYWKIRDLANCTTCEVVVFNRYGQEVLQDGNYQDDWTGTFNGRNLPDGTYYYVIKTEDDRIYKGAITIMRGE